MGENSEPMCYVKLNPRGRVTTLKRSTLHSDAFFAPEADYPYGEIKEKKMFPL